MTTLMNARIDILLNTPEDKKIFLEAILNPPAPNAKLKKAQLNYNKFLELNTSNDSDIYKNKKTKPI